MTVLPFFSEPQANNCVSLITFKVIFGVFFLLNQTNFVNVKQSGTKEWLILCHFISFGNYDYIFPECDQLENLKNSAVFNLGKVVP